MSGATAFHGMLISVVAFLAFLSLVFYLRHREAMARHQERLAAIEKGVAVPLVETRPPKLPRIFLLRGLQWFFVGVGISLMLLSISAAGRRPLSLSGKLSMAQLLKTQGASEAQVAEYMKSAADEMDGLSYAAASIGLVPMSVGLAYLVFYRKETEIAEQREAK